MSTGVHDTIAKRDILGIAVAAADARRATSCVAEAISKDAFLKVAFLNAHNANLTREHPALKDALSSSLVLSDGLGIDLASKVLHGTKFPENLNGTDFVPGMIRDLATPLHIALVGGRPGVAEKARDALAAIAPQHRFDVLENGFMDDTREAALLKRLAHERPDLLIVAMGTPRQELWIERHISARHCKVAMSVGALFDFLAGEVPRAPTLLRTLRQEWIFRLALEPSRMWRRYLVGNPVFLWRVARQKWSARRRVASAGPVAGRRVP